MRHERTRAFDYSAVSARRALELSDGTALANTEVLSYSATGLYKEQGTRGDQVRLINTILPFERVNSSVNSIGEGQHGVVTLF